MNTVIKVTIKNNYGSEAIYVIDEEIAATLKRLTGTKTLTRDHVAALKKLGFTFEIVSNVVTL